jgi:hypothetical protein
MADTDKGFPWEMGQQAIKEAHADGDINLTTYVKWAIRHDYGTWNEGKLTEIDCQRMAHRWSYDTYNSKDKIKALTLNEEDVLRAILILKEKGWFREIAVPGAIQLDLFPLKD